MVLLDLVHAVGHGSMRACVSPRNSLTPSDMVARPSSACAMFSMTLSWPVACSFLRFSMSRARGE